MRRSDWADAEANRLYDMVRDAVDDDRVIDAIALALRKAAGVETPKTLTRAEYDAARNKVSGRKKPAVQP